MKYQHHTSLNKWIFSTYIILTLLVTATCIIYAGIVQNRSAPLVSSIMSSVHTNKLLTETYDHILGIYGKFNHIMTPGQDLVDLTVSHGDTLMGILNRNGVESSDARQVVSQVQSLYNLKKLFVGQKLSLVFNNTTEYDQDLGQAENNRLDFVRINTSYDKNIEISRSGDSFIAKEVTIPLKRYLARTAGTINNSLMATAAELGIPDDALIELVKAYSYDVDFQREVKSGDQIDVLFERYYNMKGEHSHNGNIIAASLTLSGKKFELFRYTHSDGNTDFYAPDGNTIRKDLLKTPMNVVKISSTYGMRHHPVLGYSKMHKGVDFAAPVGTPILAAGDGTVEEMGRKGAYGNYIRLKHSNGYSTAYAHARGFAKNVQRGVKVKQGQVIAYVGTTGMTTGAHLHYEVLENNKHINPLKVKQKSGPRLAGSELPRFQRAKNHIQDLMKSINNHTELAMESTQAK